MTKRILTIALMLMVSFAFAQDKKEEVKDGWKKGGNVAITFNQSAFNNEWTGGGVANMAANVLVNYDMNLKKGDLVWDNKLIADYGVNKNDGDKRFTKNNDRLELKSLAGKKMKNNWYYSFYANAKTQMDTSFETVTNDNGTPLITTDDFDEQKGTSHFFSPAYFELGPGLLWKKSDNLKVNISPAAAKMTFVHAHFTEVAAAGVDAYNEVKPYYGVEANKSMRFEVGAALQGYYKTNLMKNISMENTLGLYTNYLEEPQNVDVDYTMSLVMQINKAISTNLTFQAIYDDNAQRNGFQVREAFGLGLNFKL